MKDASGRLKGKRNNMLLLHYNFIVILREMWSCLIYLRQQLDLTVVFPVDQAPLDQGQRDIFQPLRMS